ncbi:hypothetical protein ACQ86N_00335 [Puia sp. P3]|uniref:hypothetical protein n=1 Tax=Puia sp. P3 TaxID=3423952 RepID=UPI003D66E5AB
MDGGEGHGRFLRGDGCGVFRLPDDNDPVADDESQLLVFQAVGKDLFDGCIFTSRLTGAVLSNNFSLTMNS